MVTKKTTTIKPAKTSAKAKSDLAKAKPSSGAKRTKAVEKPKETVKKQEVKADSEAAAPKQAAAKPAAKEKSAPAFRGKYVYAVGRRKTATAKVRVYSGSGSILVNEKPYKEYFVWLPWQKTVAQPLNVVGVEKSFDVSVTVLGGGLSSQADASAHGIARALLKSDEAHKKVLKTNGLLTRDPRKKERKKPGLKRARRAPQWSKR